MSIRIGSGDIRGRRGESEILENASNREIGMKIDGKNKHKLRYVIDIIGTDLFSLEELAGC